MLKFIKNSDIIELYDFDVNSERIIVMRKFLATLLAVSMIASLCACNNNTESGADSGESSVTEEEKKPLSNPVAVDENGNVDMKVALSYETDIDALIKELESREPDGSKPVSKNTNPETLALFNYLKENYGKNLFAGQQYFEKGQYEQIVYYMETGDLPAIIGFDMIFSHGDQGINDQHIEDAIKWHTQQNGIVSFCWHWKVPVDIENDDVKGIAFYSDEIANFSLKNAVTPGTKEYEVVIRDIDTIALKLQRLEAAGVPVLLRPLHEASGGWVWGGVRDTDTFKGQYYQKLWYMVFDRLENYHKLTNLIWVWNGQAKKAEVNANTYDIGGMDIYPESEDHSEQSIKYSTLASIMPESKMATISECGYIPDPDKVFAADSKAKWLYFMPWNGEFVCKATATGAIITSLGGTPSINTDRMSSEFLKGVYSHDKVITLSELPDFEGTEKIIPEYLYLWELQNLDKAPENSKLKDYKKE